MIIKSFRGLLTDGQQQQINLSHNDGRTGYKIVKMQIMHADDKNTLGTTSTVIVFDNSIFNQDIYVTHSDTTGSQPANYYIELEQFPLDLSESTVVTLQNIRDIGV
jgi:predicted component of type VI protein secretion system